MKTIAVLTSTRAEYGLLSPIIHALMADAEFDVRTVVTGAHLSHEFGLTYKEIENDGIAIDRKIEMLLSADTPSAISKSMGIAMISFADYFAERRPDALMVLGDRYETLAVCCAALNERIPIIHLHGGEKTEGIIDEAIRHSITKMSYLHFTSTEEYRKRVIQLGESPDRVFNVGAVGVENIKSIKPLSLLQLEKAINFKLDAPFAVVTYHPVTLEDDTAQKQCLNLLSALDDIGKLKIIFTKANADASGRIINSMIDAYVQKNPSRACAFKSLGQQRYLSALKHCSIVIGNSSSGIIEAPSFRKPTVNIGDRQKGRVCAKSVINCRCLEKEIKEAIEYGLSAEFFNLCKSTVNPYEKEATTANIVKIIRDYLINNKIELKKKFFDQII